VQAVFGAGGFRLRQFWRVGNCREIVISPINVRREDQVDLLTAIVSQSSIPSHLWCRAPIPSRLRLPISGRSLLFSNIIHLTHVRKVAYVKPSTLKAACAKASGLGF
jgi:hypothetical protein